MVWAHSFWHAGRAIVELGVEFHCCHVSFACHYINAMIELVSVSSRFRVAKVTAFWLGLAIGVRSAESDCEMGLESHRLDPSMAVLQGLTCFFLN